MTDIEKPSADYNFWLEASKLARTLLGGSTAMKAAGKTYLSKNLHEKDELYEVRLGESTLLNAYKKTVGYLSGQVFQKDLSFGTNVGDIFHEYSKAVDVKGNNINVFCKRVFMDGLGVGVSHILVDAPVKVDKNITKAQEKALNIRPFARQIDPKDIIGWRTNSEGKLSQVRIRETVLEDDGLYNQKIVERIRVLEIGSWKVFTKNSDGVFVESAEYGSGLTNLSYIPLVTFIPEYDYTLLTGEPPLSDLAELNLRHWRSNSDQINILHVGRVPILFGRMLNIETAVVGVSAMVSTEEEHGDMKFVEISGASINAGSADLKTIEAQMALYGLQQMLPRTGSMTATEKAITTAESSSALSTWASEFESVLQRFMEIMGDYSSEVFPKEGIKVNKEYGIGIADPQELTTLLIAEGQGILSKKACFSEFKRRGAISEYTNWDDVSAEVENDLRNSTNLQNLSGTLFGNNGAA